MHRAIGSSVPGNHAKVSFGGSLVNELLESGKYVLVNSLDKVTGGPWTRIYPANPNKKSVLDLVTVSEGQVR